MNTRRLLVATGILAALAAYLVHENLSPANEPAPIGMVQRTRLKIAPEISGRLARVLVTSGEHVRAGETLAVLASPELSAALDEARAAVAGARAERDRIRSGLRREEVEIAARAVETAEANLLLARQMHTRAAALAGQGVESRQRADTAVAERDRAAASLDSRKAELAAAKAGPTAEERALAEAKVLVAQAAMRDVEARLAKLHLTAPRDATVGTVTSEPGEILPAGRPVLTLDLDTDLFFAFSIREDRLDGLTVGAQRTLVDGSGRSFPARVTEMRPLGEFATWRAARAVGDHDLNSFRIRFEPLDPATGLSPGMAVWLKPAG